MHCFPLKLFTFSIGPANKFTFPSTNFNFTSRRPPLPTSLITIVLAIHPYPNSLICTFSWLKYPTILYFNALLNPIHCDTDFVKFTEPTNFWFFKSITLGYHCNHQKHLNNTAACHFSLNLKYTVLKWKPISTRQILMWMVLSMHCPMIITNTIVSVALYHWIYVLCIRTLFQRASFVPVKHRDLLLTTLPRPRIRYWNAELIMKGGKVGILDIAVLILWLSTAILKFFNIQRQFQRPLPHT